MLRIDVLQSSVPASTDFEAAAKLSPLLSSMYEEAYPELSRGLGRRGYSSAVVWPTATSLIVARALGGLFWGFAAVHYPSWINKYGGDNETLWLGWFNACLLVGILVGYGVGAVAYTTNFITWRHLYGCEAGLMLVCGCGYCFMHPQLIQVSARVRPLNLLKRCGGLRCFVGGGDAVSGTDEGGRANAKAYSSSSSEDCGSCCVASVSRGEKWKQRRHQSGDDDGGGSDDDDDEDCSDDDDDDDDDEGGERSNLNVDVGRGGGALEEKAALLGGNNPAVLSSFNSLYKAKNGSKNGSMGQTYCSSSSEKGQAYNGGGGDGGGGDGGGDGSPLSNKPMKDPHKIRARKAIMQVLRSPLYLWTVGTGSIIAGGICFILYFITQVLSELAFFDAKFTFLMVGAVFVLSPIPGNVFGAWYVQKKLGGYRNYAQGLRFTWVMGVVSFASCLVLTAAALLKAKEGSQAGVLVSIVYVAAFYLYLFAGAAPTATINGTAVSLMPGSSIAGSGIQFSMQNTGRLIIPAIGGVVIEALGDKVVLGFQLVLICAGILGLVTSAVGYRIALQEYPPNSDDPSHNHKKRAFHYHPTDDKDDDFSSGDGYVRPPGAPAGAAGGGGGGGGGGQGKNPLSRKDANTTTTATSSLPSKSAANSPSARSSRDNTQIAYSSPPPAQAPPPTSRQGSSNTGTQLKPELSSSVSAGRGGEVGGINLARAIGNDNQEGDLGAGGSGGHFDERGEAVSSGVLNEGGGAIIAL